MTSTVETPASVFTECELDMAIVGMRPLADIEFEVEFARSGVTATVAPGVSILDAAIEQGVFVLRSCGEGVCGTCETVLLEGDPDHRDSVLSAEDRDEACFIPCVSRSRSGRLVLDL